MSTRRKFLSSISLASGSFILPSMEGHHQIPKIPSNVDLTHDEEFWHQVKMAYTVSPTLINLNNGGVCPQPKVVQDAVERYNRLSNETPSYYMWRILDKGRETIREKLADLAGTSAEELAVDRNASEALETIIFGLRLEAGDEVVLTRQDYPNMINAWKQRELRDGIVLKWLNFDFPMEDEDEIAATFEAAFTDRTKVVHITHVINWVGQILPARKIAEAAHTRDIEVVVDAAHSFAHLPYKIPELGADYLGTSLHKWLCAPFGSGMLYVKQEKIKNLYPLFAAADAESEDIRKFENLGTRSFAIEQAIGQAIDFHYMIGSERKFARLHYLKNYWMERAEKIDGLVINTSYDPLYGGAIGNFSVENMEPNQIASNLLNKHNIHTVAINWENIHGVRVTPNVYTVTADLDRYLKALEEVVNG